MCVFGLAQSSRYCLRAEARRHEEFANWRFVVTKDQEDSGLALRLEIRLLHNAISSLHKPAKRPISIHLLLPFRIPRVKTRDVILLRLHRPCDVSQGLYACIDVDAKAFGVVVRSERLFPEVARFAEAAIGSLDRGGLARHV